MKKLNFIANDDYYEVRLGSMLASYDRGIITVLYQPIIGYGALALYFTLWSEAKYNEFQVLVKHQVLCKKMGIELANLFEARRKLEGIGLLKTYRKKLDNSKYSFVYELYAPKSPQQFFDDPIYKGLLSEKLSAKEVKRLSILYSAKGVKDDSLEDVSSKFNDVYNYDQDETLKVLNIKTNRGRKTLSLASDFDVNNFLKEIKSVAQISPKAFSNDDLEEISRISTLFGFDVSTTVEIVHRCYDKDNENHLDYHKLFEYAQKMKQGVRIMDIDNEKREYSEDDKFGQKLNEFNNFSPFEYLRIKQQGTLPSPTDVKIINILSEKYNLPGPVINVVVDYTLIRCNDSLSQAYAEKIAATLVRKQITTALGACNALLSGKKKAKINTEVEEPTKDTSPTNDDVSVDDLLKELEDL